MKRQRSGTAAIVDPSYSPAGFFSSTRLEPKKTPGHPGVCIFFNLAQLELQLSVRRQHFPDLKFKDLRYQFAVRACVVAEFVPEHQPNLLIRG